MDEKKLEETCLSLVDENTSDVVQSEAFGHLARETLVKIVRRDTLNVDELCLYKACVTWAEHNCLKQNIQVMINLAPNFLRRADSPCCGCRCCCHRLLGQG